MILKNKRNPLACDKLEVYGKPKNRLCLELHRVLAEAEAREGYYVSKNFFRKQK